FEGCTPGALALFARHVDQVEVQPGEVLARAGRHPREVLVVRAGTARVEPGAGPTGFAGRGSVIGGREVLADVPHPATVRALTRMRVLVVGPRAFRWMAGEDGRWADGVVAA